MLEINVAEELKKAEEERNKPKPLPVIVFLTDDEVEEVIQPYTSPEPAKPVQMTNMEVKTGIFSDLDEHLASIKRQRGKLSSSIYHKVQSGASQEELKALVDDINGLSYEANEVIDKQDYVSKHGELPPEKAAFTVDDRAISDLKYERKTLCAYISKQKSLLKPRAKPFTPAKIDEIHHRLNEAQLKHNMVVEKINELV